MSRLGVLFQIGSLGDSIVSLPAVRSLRELLPDCDEYIIVDRFDDATKILPAEVFEMAITSRKRLSYRGPSAGSAPLRAWSVVALAAKLRYYQPYYGVYLMPSDRTEPQIARDRRFFKFAGVKQLVGFRTVDQDGTGPESGEAFLRCKRLWGELSQDQFAIHSEAPLLEPKESAERVVSRWLDDHRRFPFREIVALCPYSNWASKDLAPKTASNLIQRLEREANVEVVVVGGSKDRTAAQSVVEDSGAGLNGCGAFSIGETAALLRRVKLAVAVDSGPMHLAAAVGTPTVVVYSRTNPRLDRWFPLGTGNTVLYREVPCAGCGLAVCPVSDHPCIDGVGVDEIWDAALSSLFASDTPEIRGGTKVLKL
jgi:ADP-heptose:LPS heptosyltransferase